MVISFSRRLSRAATGSLLPAPVLWTSSISLREPGQKISDVLFRMTAAAVITGRVNNEDGEPMIRVQVVALRRPTEEETEEDIPFASRKQTLIPVASSQTDDRGQYRIFGVKPANITYGRRTHSNPITMYRLLMRTIGFGNTSVVNTPRCTTPE